MQEMGWVGGVCGIRQEVRIVFIGLLEVAWLRCGPA